jgi:hypothetical protein
MSQSRPFTAEAGPPTAIEVEWAGKVSDFITARFRGRAGASHPRTAILAYGMGSPSQRLRVVGDDNPEPEPNRPPVLLESEFAPSRSDLG